MHSLDGRGVDPTGHSTAAVPGSSSEECYQRGNVSEVKIALRVASSPGTGRPGIVMVHLETSTA